MTGNASSDWKKRVIFGISQSFTTWGFWRNWLKMDKNGQKVAILDNFGKNGVREFWRISGLLEKLGSWRGLEKYLERRWKSGPGDLSDKSGDLDLDWD